MQIAQSYKERSTTPGPRKYYLGLPTGKARYGIEKPPFQLPSYIADTGIATQGDAIKEKEANMSLKFRTRERLQPKMDINYPKPHDAYFKFQTKPPLTGFGETYYEGEEFDTLACSDSWIECANPGRVRECVRMLIPERVQLV